MPMERTRTSRRTAVVTVCTVLVLLTLTGFAWHRAAPTHETVTSDWSTRDATVSADGRKVTVTYAGRGCGTATTRVDVRESVRRVVLTVVTRRDVLHGVCAAMGARHSIVATLTAPLGGRALVVGYCAHPDWDAPHACA